MSLLKTLVFFKASYYTNTINQRFSTLCVWQNLCCALAGAFYSHQDDGGTIPAGHGGANERGNVEGLIPVKVWKKTPCLLHRRPIDINISRTGECKVHFLLQNLKSKNLMKQSTPGLQGMVVFICVLCRLASMAEELQKVGSSIFSFVVFSQRSSFVTVKPFVFLGCLHFSFMS